MDIRAGSTDQSVSFAAFTTATGAAVTVTSATAGLSLWYRRGGTGPKVAISPSDLATLETAHADGGILVVQGQEHRLDLPDAAVAAGVTTVAWGGSATGITIDGGQANLIGQATTGSVGDVQAAAAAAITAYDPPTKAEMDAGFSGLDLPTRAILSGTVDAVTSNSDLTLTSDDLSATDNQYAKCWLVFVTGNNKAVGRMIGVYTGNTKRVQFTGNGTRGAFPSTVQAGDQWYLMPNTDLVAGIVGVQAS